MLLTRAFILCFAEWQGAKNYIQRQKVRAIIRIRIRSGIIRSEVENTAFSGIIPAPTRLSDNFKHRD